MITAVLHINCALVSVISDSHHWTQVNHLPRLQCSSSYPHLHWRSANYGNGCKCCCFLHLVFVQKFSYGVNVAIMNGCPHLELVLYQSGLNEPVAPFTGLNLSGRQKDGGQEQNATPLCQTGPSVHCSPKNSWDHLPWDLQRFPSNGTFHLTRWR